MRLPLVGVRLRRTRSVLIELRFWLIESSVRRSKSNWGCAPEVESVRCRRPSASPGTRSRTWYPIMYCVAPLIRDSPSLHGRVARHLLRPRLVRMPRDPGQAHAAALQMNEEQYVVGDQPTPSKDLHSKEVDPGQNGQMRLDEFLPRCVLAPFRVFGSVRGQIACQGSRQFWSRARSSSAEHLLLHAGPER